MKDEPANDELLTRYALGRLSETDLERVEGQVFSDKQLFERLLAVEDDLIDAYTGGRLSEDDRRRFRRYLLQDRADLERVEFARQLAEVVSRETVARQTRSSRLAAWLEALKGRMNPVLVAAMLLLVLAGSWLVFQTVTLRKQLEMIEAERIAAHERAQELEKRIAAEREQNRSLSEELDRERAPKIEDQTRPQPSASSLSFVSLILSPGAVRERGATATLALPPNASQVRIQARFRTGSYPSYRAELQTVEGRVLWQQAGLKSRTRREGQAVSFVLAATTLRDDDYILVLKGVTPAGEEESVGEYFFRVQR